MKMLIDRLTQAVMKAPYDDIKERVEEVLLTSAEQAGSAIYFTREDVVKGAERITRIAQVSPYKRIRENISKAVVNLVRKHVRTGGDQ